MKKYLVVWIVASVVSGTVVRAGHEITKPGLRAFGWYESIVCSSAFHWFVTGDWSAPQTGMCDLQ